MLNFSKLYYLFIVYILNVFLFSSCSYEATELNLGSTLSDTWSFSKSSDYNFNDNLVEIANGKAQLKQIDLENTGEDFNTGTHVGTFFDSSSQSLKLLNNKSSALSVIDILPISAHHLVGYWQFESDFSDSSVLGNDGSPLADASISTASQVGEGAAAFDGVGDGLELGPIDILNEAESFSISIWVYHSSMVGDDDIFNLSTHLISSPLIIWRDEDVIDSYNIVISDSHGHQSGVLSSSTVPAQDKWTHLAVIFTGGDKVQLFIDGIEDANSPFLLPNVHNVKEPSPSLPNYYIGTSSYSGKEFDGFIDELAVWSTALDPSSMVRIYEMQRDHFTQHSSAWTPNWSTVLGYWTMDGHSKDSSGHDKDGVIFDNFSFTLSPQVGSHSSYMDGSGDYMSVANLWTAPASSLSMCGWVNAITATPVNHLGIMYKGSAGFEVYLNTTGQLVSWIRNNSSWHRSVESASFDDWNQWHHVCGVYDGSFVYLYRNGVQVAQSALESGDIPISNNFFVGYQSGTGANAEGYVDDVVVWGSVLSAEDISIIFNRQKQKYAAHYDSPVVDLGKVGATWPDLSWVTTLPFGKELVGDSNNDASSDDESATVYSGLSGNLNHGLVGYWPLNESSKGTIAGGADHEDKSVNNNHLTESGTTFVDQDGFFGKALGFNRSGEATNNSPTGSILLDPNDDFTVSYWAFLDPEDDVPTDSRSLLVYLRTDLGGYVFDTMLRDSASSGKGSLVMWRWNGTSSSSVNSPVGSIDKVGWYHLTFKKNNNDLYIYLNGQQIAIGTDVITYTGHNVSAIRLGVYNRFKGRLDEVGIWNRSLSSEEIRQLYLRGGNRVKIQVKSCIDSSCNCESYGVGGVESDCDGDGTLNEYDNSDLHKAKFVGPGGDGTTHYSEYYNRGSVDISFNCGLNATDSNPSVCVADEITFLGGSQPESPQFLNSDYRQFIQPSANQYAQYRVLFEADDNKACAGKPCLPDLKLLSLNPQKVSRYSRNFTKVSPKSPIEFSNLYSAEIIADACASFTLVRESTEYYYDGLEWIPATLEAHKNSASEVEDNITKFATKYGAGSLGAQAYLQSNLSQTSQCSIQSVDIKYD